MANTKDYSMRELLIDKYLSTGEEYTREELQELVNSGLAERSMHPITAKSTMMSDINEMNGKFFQMYNRDGIVCERRGHKFYYRYANGITSIYNRELTQEEIEKLFTIRALLKGLKGMPQSEWVDEMVAHFDQNMMGSKRLVVSFEEGAKKDAESFQDIFDAIVDKKVLKLRYQKFGTEPSERKICPYFLKQYNHRWYMFVHDEKREGIVCFALDRIVSVSEMNDEEFIKTDVDFNHYFDHVVGVTVPKDGVVERVVLKVDDWVANYLQTYPIHHSQQISRREDGTSELTLDVIITHELEQELLVYGEHVTVEAPAKFKEEMKNRVINMFNNYE